jgi:hypothetical protein
VGRKGGANAARLVPALEPIERLLCVVHKHLTHKKRGGGVEVTLMARKSHGVAISRFGDNFRNIDAKIFSRCGVRVLRRN